MLPLCGYLDSLRHKGTFSLSQKAYIDRVLRYYGIQNCAPRDMPMGKGNKFNLIQCPMINIVKKKNGGNPILLEFGPYHVGSETLDPCPNRLRK